MSRIITANQLTLEATSKALGDKLAVRNTIVGVSTIKSPSSEKPGSSGDHSAHAAIIRNPKATTPLAIRPSIRADTESQPSRATKPGTTYGNGW
jgi:hypothetical protein